MQTEQSREDLARASTARVSTPPLGNGLPSVPLSDCVASIKRAVWLASEESSDFYRSNLPAKDAMPDLSTGRQAVRATSIPGPAVLPFYTDSYEGTFNTSASKHLPSIIPGYVPPPADEIRQLDDWIKGDPQRAQFCYGTMNASEAALVRSVIRALQPRLMFEFGTHQGILTNRMMEVAPQDAVMITVDLPPSKLDQGIVPIDPTNRSYVKHQDEHMGMHIDPVFSERVIRLQEDSMRLNISPLQGCVDLVVVDGNHSYKVAKNDIKKGWEMLREGGVMLIDDFKLLRTEGVIRAVYEHRSQTRARAYLVSFADDLDTSMVLMVKDSPPSPQRSSNA